MNRFDTYFCKNTYLSNNHFGEVLKIQWQGDTPKSAPHDTTILRQLIEFLRYLLGDRGKKSAQIARIGIITTWEPFGRPGLD